MSAILSVKDLIKQSESSVMTPFINDSSDDSQPAPKSRTPKKPPPPLSPHTPENTPPPLSRHTPDNLPPPTMDIRSADERQIQPADLFQEDLKLTSKSTNDNKSTPQQKFDYLVNYFYNLNPFVYTHSSNYELEVRYGTRGIKPLSRTDYDNVIKKLKSFGFTCINPTGEYSLRMSNEFVNSNTGKFKLSDIRVEINGLHNIQKYCKTNDLKSLYNFDVTSTNFLRKHLVQTQQKELLFPVNFDEFNFRVSLNTETKVAAGLQQFILDSWKKTKKNYRYLNRVTFTHENYPCKVDITIAKYADKHSKKIGNFIKEEMVTTYNVDESNVFNNNEVFEIEIEVDNTQIGPSTPFDSPKLVLDAIKKVIKFILSGLQSTNFPISYPEQKTVLQSYMKMIWQNEYDGKKYISSKYFIGPNSRTLQLTNIAPIKDSMDNQNITKDYVVTEKADGQRHLMYINQDGKVYLITTSMSVIFTGAKTVNKDCFNCLLDGELILCNKLGEFINLFTAFDIYYYTNHDVRGLSFMLLENEKDIYKSRYQILKLVTSTINLTSILDIKSTSKNVMNTLKEQNQLLSPIKMTCKQFYPYSKKQSIFNACNEILSKVDESRFDYETDGLIFTHAYFGVGSDKIGEPGPKKRVRWDYSFKWKPPKFNTIDFLVTTLKTASGSEIIKPVFEAGTNTELSSQLSEYKIIELRCGFNPKFDGYINPCQDIIDDKLPDFSDAKNYSNDYFPMRFYPTDPYDANAGLCKIMLRTDDTGVKQMFSEENEVFNDNTIVEFSYDQDKENEWRWIPLRVRHDKTHELRQGEKQFGNAYETCNNNWNSIHNPVTENMIRTGENIPDLFVSEDKYYNTPSGKFKTEGMKNFHNLFVKRLLISSVSKQGDTLIDFSCGKAGDLAKWIEARLSFVFGIDISKDNLENRINGACTRFLNSKKENKYMPGALFANGNSSLNIKNGSALLNDKAKQITSAIFGIGKKDEARLGKGVFKHFGIGSNGFNIASSQFSLHYFFETPETLQGFIRNVSECTKLNGYFIGCAYDGKKVFGLLNKIKTGESIQIVDDGKKIWEIVKGYGSDTFEDDSSSIGYKIDVYQESINQLITEYLINFDYFNRIMELYGLTIISKEEATELGLPNGTGMFEELFNLMLGKIEQNKFIKKNYGKAENMTSFEKKISFLNRYFVYKKIREVNTEKVQLELSEYSEIQQQLNKSATSRVLDRTTKSVPGEATISAPKLKKISKKITLVQATESHGIPDTGTVKEKSVKSVKKPKLIIQED